MRADNTSVVTLMLDPPGPPRATVLRSRTTQKPQASVASAPAQAAAKADAPAEADARQVPQNGLTIMTRYSDVDKPAASPDAPEKTPLPPCATLDGRFSVGPPDEPPKDADDDDADAITNYGNPAESYFMARLLNRSRTVNTLSRVYDEIVNGRTSKAPSEARETPPPPPTTVGPEAGDGDRRRSPEKDPAEDATEDEPGDGDDARAPGEDVGIQINEVSSSSPTEGPPRRGRRPKSEGRRDAPAPNDRVLRSHHEPEAPARPHTRQAATRGRAPAPPAAPLERVVILSRRAPPAPPVPRAERPAPRRPAEPAPGAPATRSQAPSPAGPGPAASLAPKTTRSIGGAAREPRAPLARPGNSPRAPGPARRAPAARREPSLGSKENLGAARRRVRTRAAPAEPRPRTRRADSSPEVHSTTGERPACAAPPAPAPLPPPRPRALRSRNDAEAPPAAAAGGKRARAEEAPGAGAAKAPKLAAERCARALGKRASGPWAPALALRNRLRKRLAK